MLIKIVERNKIGIAVEEMKLQVSGAVNDKMMVKIGEMVGANVVVFGTIADLEEELDIQVKVMSIEKSTLLAGVSYKIKKTNLCPENRHEQTSRHHAPWRRRLLGHRMSQLARLRQPRKKPGRRKKGEARAPQRNRPGMFARPERLPACSCSTRKRSFPS